MCGITGFFATGRRNWTGTLTDTVARMSSTLRHRGPDDSGEWTDDASGIAFGFRRLSIIDLSPAGHQPMESASGRYVIAFNGEVYNYEAVRERLRSEGVTPAYRGHSDTEVMLTAIETWGLERAVGEFIGMFGFALWDRRERRLHLVRDRVGVKPLYYGWASDTLLFGSELKALRAHPDFQAEIDRGSVALLMRHNYVPAPYTIYKGIHKLTPGTILTIDGAASRDAQPRAYWSARAAAEQGVAHPFTGSEDAAEEELHALLNDAVGLRMVADVPLGVFLSGGIDSSLVAALMQARSARPVKTFTIGFHESGYNEAQHAAEVARHLGTDHTELYVTPAETMAVIPRLPSMYDEPFADSSQIPTFLVSQLARKHVTVSLSGDGGDELFGGYNRYFWGRRIWQKLRLIPSPARKAFARLLTAVPPDSWDSVFRLAAPVLPSGMRQTTPGYRLHKLAGILSVSSPAEMYRRLISQWQDPSELIADAEHPTINSDGSGAGELRDFTDRMMYVDLVSYLPDDILAKVDRASMATSLEAREPLLDHRLIELAWRLPLDMKIRDGKGKHLLRKVLYRYVPQSLIERPKMGFGVPIDEWLRGPLRGWAEELLSEPRLRREGYFNPATVRRVWDEHLSGRRNMQYQLWIVLMFQAWLAETHPS